MKKILFILPLFFSVSFGAVSVNWANTSPYTTDGSTPVPNGYFAQLIWTDLQALTLPDTVNPFIPTGANEEVVQTQVIAGGFGAGFVFANFNLADSYAGGFLYTRVFDNNSTPTVYGQSLVGDIGGNNQNGPTEALTVTTIDPTTTNNFFKPGFEVSAAIPEPSSVMLVGVALSAMMLMRRRFRK